MAVVYFTSNASTGAGSLVEAIKNASPGDVIRPDETVFERGSIIEIALASTLTIDKTLTLDGGPYRVRLNGDGRPRCCAIASGVSVEITSFDFIGGGWNSQTGADVGNANGGGIYVPSGSTVALTRCGFLGCRGTYGGGVHIAVDSIGTLSDCVIAGCYARGLAGGAFCNGAVKIYGSTIVGNAASDADVLAEGKSAGTVLFNCIVGKIKGKVESDAGSVVDVASSAIGFVVAPPDDFSVDNWTANAWQNWDLRLLDDASGAPSPFRDSGDVGAMSRYDLDGNFRGRETNGVATCSPGAYETLQADLFWIGRDATGAEVASPSWVNADGWAASRFATASGDVAPQANDNIFIDGVVSIDGTSLAFTRFIVGGGAKIGFSASGTKTLTATCYDVGVGATIESTAGTQKLGVRSSTSVSRFGDYAFVHIPMSASANQNFQIAQTARFSDFANSVIVYAAGNFVIYRFNLSSSALLDGDVENVVDLRITANTHQLTASNSPRIRCERFTWTRASGQTGPGLTDGSTPLTIAPTTLVSATLNAPGDFSVDVSNATNLSLSLSGQTVYGDAPSSAVSLTGSATVDERGLASQSLTLNADATLNVDGGFACVETLTVADGASVAFSSERGDAVLTATESATVDAASFAGVGYFATPSGTDLTAATIAETVRVVECGANVETFAATATGPTTAKLEWSATDATKPVYVERQNAVAPNGWETIAVASTAEASPLTVALTGRERFRVFDGQTFRVDAADGSALAPFWQVAAWGVVAPESPEGGDDSTRFVVATAWAVPVDRAL